MARVGVCDDADARILAWCGKISLIAKSFTISFTALLAGCVNAPAAKTTTVLACEDGVSKPCTCDDGSSGTKLCVEGIYQDCSCATTDASSDSLPRDTAENGDATGGSDTANTSDTVSTSDATGTPSTCASDKDCKDAGKVCDPLTKQCVTCLTDAECIASVRIAAKLIQPSPRN